MITELLEFLQQQETVQATHVESKYFKQLVLGENGEVVITEDADCSYLLMNGTVYEFKTGLYDATLKVMSQVKPC